MVELCIRKSDIMPAFVRVNVTATYHPASIDATVMLKRPVATQPMLCSTKWLNIAMKNKAIFGFNIDMKKPSKPPRIKALEEAVREEISASLGPVFANKIRKPIYTTRHAPSSWAAINISDIATTTFANPIAVKSAHKPIPTAWPNEVAIPYARPPARVFAETRAKLGPGEAAPRKQTNIIWDHERISNRTRSLKDQLATYCFRITAWHQSRHLPIKETISMCILPAPKMIHGIRRIKRMEIYTTLTASGYLELVDWFGWK